MSLVLTLPVSGYSEENRYFFHQKGFSICLPDNWKALDSNDFVIFTARHPDNNVIDISVSLNHRTEPPTLDQWMETTLSVYKKYPQFKGIEDKGETTIDTIKSKWFTCFIDDTKQMRQVLINNHVVYEITCKAKREAFETYYATFVDILQTIELHEIEY